MISEWELISVQMHYLRYASIHYSTHITGKRFYHILFICDTYFFCTFQFKYGEYFFRLLDNCRWLCGLNDKAVGLIEGRVSSFTSYKAFSRVRWYIYYFFLNANFLCCWADYVSLSLGRASKYIPKEKNDEFFELIGHSQPVYGLSFSPDNQFLLSCSADGTARLWSGVLANVVWCSLLTIVDII